MKRLVRAAIIFFSVGILLFTGISTASAASSGWYKQSGNWRYRMESDSDATGWVKDKGKWYYMDGSGTMRTGWVFNGSRWYYMTGSGAMATGWQKIKGTWYFMQPSGAMACNQWVGDYYLQSNGSMAANKWIGQYFIGDDGKWIPNYGNGNVVESSPSDGDIGVPPEQASPPVYEEKMVFHEGLSRRVFDNINAERVKAGLPPYIWQDRRCGTVARLQAGYNVLRFNPDTMVIGKIPFDTHYILDISYFTDRKPKAAADRAVESWKESGLHKAILLSDFEKYCAVAVYSYQDAKGRQWVSIIAAMSNVDVDLQSYDTKVPKEYWNQILNCETE